MSWKNKIIAITPFVSLITFFILWLKFDLAHPGWIVFLLIPLMPFIVGKRKISVSTIVIAIYLITSLITKEWQITWVILFLIPIIHILLIPSDKKNKKIRFRFNDPDDDFDEF